MEIIVDCPAKINLFLNITGKSDYGSHFLNMINQSVSLFDTIAIRKTSSKLINISCDNSEVPIDENNSVYKISRQFFKYTSLPFSGLDIDIKKRIPMESGLGGESTDAAGVLVALDEMFQSHLSRQEFLNIGLKVGSDVPFCIMGGYKKVTGFGGLIDDIGLNLYDYYVIIKPSFRCNTQEMFKKYDSLITSYQTLEYDYDMHNDFDQIVSDNLLYIKDDLQEFGATTTGMTGTGPAIVGCFDNHYTRDDAFWELKDRYPNIYSCNNCSGIKIKKLVR